MSWEWILAGFGFGVYESLWRRWFGGGLDKGWLKIFDHRFLKHCVNLAALFAVCRWWRGLEWTWSLYAALVLQILFWTMTFGMYFDIGRSGQPEDEYEVSEYNKSWFAPVLNWCFDAGKRYTDYYDYVGMFIRFTAPALLLFWVPTFNSGLLFLGSVVSMAYGIGWVSREKSLLRRISPTAFGELVSGFATGLYWWFLGMCG